MDTEDLVVVMVVFIGFYQVLSEGVVSRSELCERTDRERGRGQRTDRSGDRRIGAGNHFRFDLS
jgi:hypothetical protein